MISIFFYRWRKRKSINVSASAAFLQSVYIWYICHPDKESFLSWFLVSFVVGSIHSLGQYEISVHRLRLSSYSRLERHTLVTLYKDSQRESQQNFTRKIKHGWLTTPTLSDLHPPFHCQYPLFCTLYSLGKHIWHGVLKQTTPCSSTEETQQTQVPHVDKAICRVHLVACHMCHQTLQFKIWVVSGSSQSCHLANFMYHISRQKYS